MSKILFIPFSVIGGILAGIVGKKTFEALWGVVDNEDAPRRNGRPSSAVLERSPRTISPKLRLRFPRFDAVKRPDAFLTGLLRWSLPTAPVRCFFAMRRDSFTDCYPGQHGTTRQARFSPDGGSAAGEHPTVRRRPPLSGRQRQALFAEARCRGAVSSGSGRRHCAAVPGLPTRVGAAEMRQRIASVGGPRLSRKGGPSRRSCSEHQHRLVDADHIATDHAHHPSKPEQKGGQSTRRSYP